MIIGDLLELYAPLIYGGITLAVYLRISKRNSKREARRRKFERMKLEKEQEREYIEDLRRSMEHRNSVRKLREDINKRPRCIEIMPLRKATGALSGPEAQALLK